MTQTPEGAVDPLRNPKDPLRSAMPEPGRVLMQSFARAAAGFPRDAVVDAAVNLLVNALRQEHGTRAAVERAFDELSGKAKQMLLDHYDSLGRKRGIFAFDQVISVQLFDVRKSG